MRYVITFFVGVIIGFSIPILILIIVIFPRIDFSKPIHFEIEEINEETKENGTEED